MREDAWDAPEPQDEPEDGPARPASEDWPEAGALAALDGAPRDAQLDAAFAGLLRALRTLPGPCAPPVGAGAFDILYASEREVVVWYAPARDGVEQREVAIPGGLVRAAWALALRGEPVGEAALRALAPGAAGGRWLLALLAQVPGVETQRAAVDTDAATSAPGEAADSAVSLLWRGPAEG